MMRPNTGHIYKGNQCRVRIRGECIPAEVLDVRDRIIRLHCRVNGVPRDGTGLVLEFQERQSVAGYYARVLTASPDSLDELVLLRTASLNREELRTNLRVPVEIPVILESESMAAPQEAKLLNISAGGAYFETSSLLRGNGSPRLRLTMIDEPALRVQGDVIHMENGIDSRLHRIGVRFAEIDSEDVRALTWYVWSRVRAFFPDAD